MYGHETLDVEEIIKQYDLYADKLKKYVTDLQHINSSERIFPSSS